MLNLRSLPILLLACGPGAQPNTAAAPLSMDAGVLDAAPAFTIRAGIALPTGGALTADAAPGSVLYELDPKLPQHPEFRAGFAVSSALSPDGKVLAVLTSGYNQLEDGRGEGLPDASSEYVFVYDVLPGGLKVSGVVSMPDAFVGLAFSPSGDRLFVSGGSDDVVHELARDEAGKLAERAPAIAMGHRKPDGLGGLGLDEGPYVAGIAVSPSGAKLVAANHENDSISLVDLTERKVVKEVDLRPGKGVAGGEFPMGVLLVGEDRAYVSSQRDREVDEVDLAAGKVTRRVKTGGQPTRIIATRDQKKLFVANANSDTVSVIDRESFVTTEEIRVGGPMGSLALSYRGSNPNALRLSPDEQTLYVSLGGNNAIAVVKLATEGMGVSKVTGLIPTGFYPNDVVVASDGRTLFIPFGKSVAGPNVRGPRGNRAHDLVGPPYEVGGDGRHFSLQLMRGGVHSLPVPDDRVLDALTHQALQNNHLDAPPTVPPIFEALKGKIEHVIFVVGENRTYDQLLGDVQGADGDPSLTLWGEAYSPNLHALVKRFALLDRFFDSGGVSGDGWQWTMAARTSDVAEKGIPVEYGGPGKHTYDWEGTNRNINVSLATEAERLEYNPATPKDADLLPGQADVAGVDGPNQGGHGYLWDTAMGAGRSFRNYGCFVDDYRYGLKKTDRAYVAPIAEPYKQKMRVAFPSSPGLKDTTDPYFRGFDMKVADYWRVKEWARELAEYEKHDDLPALELVRLPHDHLGSFAKASDGVNTPDLQIADHDYALGLLVERLSKSKYWESTLVVALEDDAQNGSDHVDAHRSFVAFAGGHAKRGAVIHGRYTTVSALRTIELLLGLAPMAQGDATAAPIADALSEEVDHEPFVAIVPDILRTTKLPLPASPAKLAVLPRGDAAYWDLATMGMDFDHADRLPAHAFNRALTCGLLATTGCASTEAPIAKDDDD